MEAPSDFFVLKCPLRSVVVFLDVMQTKCFDIVSALCV